MPKSNNKNDLCPFLSTNTYTQLTSIYSDDILHESFLTNIRFPFIFLVIPGTQSRYTVLEQPGGVSILRIEPVRSGRDDAPYECVAENGVGDAVSADATLTVYEGKCLPHQIENFIPSRRLCCNL